MVFCFLSQSLYAAQASPRSEISFKNKLAAGLDAALEEVRDRFYFFFFLQRVLALS